MNLDSKRRVKRKQIGQCVFFHTNEAIGQSGRYRQFHEPCHYRQRRRRDAGFRLHETFQHLRPALGGRGFGLVAASVRWLVGLQCGQKLRAGEAVPPEQRHYHQRCHDRIGNCPHLNFIVHGSPEYATEFQMLLPFLLSLKPADVPAECSNG
jgi:hypothetical protein